MLLSIISTAYGLIPCRQVREFLACVLDRYVFAEDIITLIYAAEHIHRG